MKKIVGSFVFFSVFTFVLSIASVFAQDYVKPDITGFTNIERSLKTNVCEEIFSSSQWKELENLASAKIDAAVKEKMNEPGFPKPIIEPLLKLAADAVGKSNVADLTTKDVINLLGREIEAVQLNIWADNPQKPDVLVNVFVKFDPVVLNDSVKSLPPGLLSKKASKDGSDLFELSADGNKSFFKYAKLPNRSDYVITFSTTEERIDQQFANLGNEDITKMVFSTTGPFKAVYIYESFYYKVRDFASQVISNSNVGQNEEGFLKVIENLESFSYTVDQPGKYTQLTWNIVMKNEEEAKNVNDLAAGGLAFAKMMLQYNNEMGPAEKKALTSLTNIKVVQSGTSVTASLELSDPALFDFVKTVMEKAIADLK
ncbi:MAG: hypothetical protein ACRC2T_20920 [Thermoguttaceae bacterium]